MVRRLPGRYVSFPSTSVPNRIIIPHIALFLILVSLVWLLAALTQPTLANKAAVGYNPQANDLIASVNALRVAHGLPAYRINNALMAAAQAHSDYQASIHTITHTGAGGTVPRQRAIAAGYGGGQTVFVSENIAGGTNMTAEIAVSLWQGDDIHLNTMLSPYIRDAGAGVASDGTMYYFTLDAGYIAGESGNMTPEFPSGTPTTNPAMPSPTASLIAQWIIPVQTVTPGLDGSITHIVQSGQSLIQIARAYQVELQTLLTLNHLHTTSVIYPNQRLQIKPPDPTPTPSQLPTSTPRPTATTRPTRTPTRITSPTSTIPLPIETTSPPDNSPVLSVRSFFQRDPFAVVIIGLAILGILLLFTSSALQRKR